MRVNAACLLTILFASSASGFRIPSSGERISRRAAVATTALSAVALPLAAFADTLPELSGSQAGFDAAAEKRAKFLAKQKVFKKAWRKELSNLEFAADDAEAEAAVEALIKLIYQNGKEIPEGVRKMDLDQVYKIQKAKLGKDARMKFAKLDQIVKEIVTVKPMGLEDPF